MTDENNKKEGNLKKGRKMKNGQHTFFFSFLPVSGPAAAVVHEHHQHHSKKLFSLAKFPSIKELALFSFLSFFLKSNSQRCAVRPAFQKNSTVSQGRPLHSELEKPKKNDVVGRWRWRCWPFSDLSNWFPLAHWRRQRQAHSETAAAVKSIHQHIVTKKGGRITL